MHLSKQARDSPTRAPLRNCLLQAPWPYLSFSMKPSCPLTSQSSWHRNPWSTLTCRTSSLHPSVAQSSLQTDHERGGAHFFLLILSFKLKPTLWKKAAAEKRGTLVSSWMFLCWQCAQGKPQSLLFLVINISWQFWLFVSSCSQDIIIFCLVLPEMNLSLYKGTYSFGLL